MSERLGDGSLHLSFSKEAGVLRDYKDASLLVRGQINLVCSTIEPEVLEAMHIRAAIISDGAGNLTHAQLFFDSLQSMNHFENALLNLSGSAERDRAACAALMPVHLRGVFAPEAA